jgi:hypothetical protein
VLFGVLEAHPFPTNTPAAYDTVAIVGLDGYARAKTQLTPITPPNLGIGPLLPPQAYAASGRVYFLDGKGVVWSLASDGTIAKVTAFPVPSAQHEVSFAVSPDGNRLMGTVTNFSPVGAISVAGIDVYAAAAGQAPVLLRHQQSGAGLSFIGWDSVGPIGTDPTFYGTQGGSASHWSGMPVRVDAQGNSIGPSGGAGCNASDDAADGTTACLMGGGSSGYVSVRDRDGREIWRSASTPNGYLYAFINADRQRVVAFDGGSPTYAPVMLGSDGSKVSIATMYQQGWLDNSTVIGSVPYPELGLVRLSDPMRIVDLGFKGTFIGVVRPAS